MRSRKSIGIFFVLAAFVCAEGFAVRAASAGDLSIVIEDFPDPLVLKEDDITYAVTIRNLDAPDSTNVVLSGTLPLNVTVASTSPECTSSPGTVTCTHPTLAAGAEVVSTIIVTPGDAGTYDFSTTVSANEADPNPANNSATAQTTVTDPEDPGDDDGFFGCRLNSAANGNPTSMTGWGLLALPAFGLLLRRALRST